MTQNNNIRPILVLRSSSEMSNTEGHTTSPIIVLRKAAVVEEEKVVVCRLVQVAQFYTQSLLFLY